MIKKFLFIRNIIKDYKKEIQNNLKIYILLPIIFLMEIFWMIINWVLHLLEVLPVIKNNLKSL